MIIQKPPKKLDDKHTDKFKVFFAGSIEMGNAIDWQSALTKVLSGYDIAVLNPRRDDWDSSWEQTIENDQFREQVEWELEHLELADVIVLYFSPETKAPISLLELGLHANDDKLIVYCPEGFWRKGNVDIVCNQYNVTQCDNWDDVVEELAKRFLKFQK